tara:strand:+ start:27 stop:761 length:735 start_codon:yes stop_codon:yes gene_type:complete
MRLLKRAKYLILLGFISTHIGCQYNCNSFKENPVKLYGIDVSQYQDEKKAINWEQVVKNNNPKISFVYIRSTMGSDGIDKSCKNNMLNAKKNKLQTGVYHYYRPNEPAKKQFENFIKNNKEIGNLPPVIDIEEKSELGMQKLRNELLFFLESIENEYGIQPIIYAHQNFYNLYLRNHFKKYNLWIARQNGISKSPENNKMKKEPFLWNNRCPLIWQYSGTGLVSGISSPVDLNVTNKFFWLTEN